MSLIFEHYWPLLLLALIPWLGGFARFRCRSQRQASPAFAADSSGLHRLLALALMQPTLLRSSARIATVYLLDVSNSMSPVPFRMRCSGFAKPSEAGASSSSKFLAFGANSLAFDTPEELAKVPVSSKAQPGAIDQSKTRLAAAWTMPHGRFRRTI